MSNDALKEIHQILKKKLDAYTEFLDLTLLLKKALEAEEMAVAARMIERRATLIGVIDGLDREAGRYRKTVPYHLMGIIARGTASISSDMDEKIRRILSANGDCCFAATERLTKVKRELQSLRDQEEGLRGYNRHSEPMARFLNVRT
jgi:hypothetical protein